MVLDALPGPAVSVAVITGAAGLVGSQAARHFAGLGFTIVGLDNDMRGKLFGPEGSTRRNQQELRDDLGDQFTGYNVDIRDREAVAALLLGYRRHVELVIHCASQPSHDGADPLVDWDIDAGGTVNVLEAVRRHCPDALVVHMSTIKVYGPHPNALPYTDGGTRYELDLDYPEVRAWWDGFHEGMSIDGGPRSVFGASKTAADVMAQEYGHLGVRTVILRPGCLTGSGHAGVEAHGMLSWLMRCVATETPYRIFGYGGKQVRDQLHAADVATAIERLYRDPPEPGTVYNLGGGRGREVSILEALQIAEQITGRTAKVDMLDEPRRGDHRWWVTDMGKFCARYPEWRPTYDVPAMMREIHEARG
jgi:CDP-paratose 2-epimerase